MILPAIKKCGRCKEWKSVPESFGKNRAHRFGFTNRCRECGQVQRLNDREQKREYDARRYKVVRETRREQQQKYYADNRERIIQATAEWRTENPEQLRRNHRLQSARRRARLAGVENTLTAEQERALFVQYDGRCYVCRLAHADTLDHVIPIVKDGAHSAWNGRPACDFCNKSKGAKDVLVWLEPRWHPVWTAPLVMNYDVPQRYKDGLARVLEAL